MPRAEVLLPKRPIWFCHNEVPGKPEADKFTYDYRQPTCWSFGEGDLGRRKAPCEQVAHKCLAVIVLGGPGLVWVGQLLLILSERRARSTRDVPY